MAGHWERGRARVAGMQIGLTVMVGREGGEGQAWLRGLLDCVPECDFQFTYGGRGAAFPQDQE